MGQGRVRDGCRTQQGRSRDITLTLAVTLNLHPPLRCLKTLRRHLFDRLWTARKCSQQQAQYRYGPGGTYRAPTPLPDGMGGPSEAEVSAAQGKGRGCARESLLLQPQALTPTAQTESTDTPCAARK